MEVQNGCNILIIEDIKNRELKEIIGILRKKICTLKGGKVYGRKDFKIF